VLDPEPMVPVIEYGDSSLTSGTSADLPEGTSTEGQTYGQENPPGQWVEVPGQWIEGKWVPSHKVWVPQNP